jgi:hypothetical protein
VDTPLRSAPIDSRLEEGGNSRRAARAIVAPHTIQLQALEALEETRRKGFSAGLVVLATGLGKTWLSAFDSDRGQFRRILFVAHREEILNQAIENFRRVRPNASIGRMIGPQKDSSANLVFASVQTLGRIENLKTFEATYFDYIVIDEFHHAAAVTFLLVTLAKEDMNNEHRYVDHFVSDREFAWQSQNRTTRASKNGQILSNHQVQGKRVHLFVRPTKKTGQKPTPFFYCGEVDFVSWEGDAPISIKWRLREAVPPTLRGALNVP